VNCLTAPPRNILTYLLTYLLKVLKLAHDSVFGGHMGEKKTQERIRPSFYWPGLR